MLNAYDVISWIKENRDVTVTILFNFSTNLPMITMRYVKHPTWNYLAQTVLSDEVNYIDVLETMKEELTKNLRPKRLKEECYVNSIYNMYGILKEECIDCPFIKENKDEELYCSKRESCDMEVDEFDGYLEEDE